MKLLNYFRKHGAARHWLFSSVYKLRGWTYTDRSCLPPVITNPEGQEVSEDACLKDLSLKDPETNEL